MTMSGDFADNQDYVAPSYPTVFGITFTPTITGALVAVLGLAGAVYIFLSLVQPAMQENQTLETDVAAKEEQVKQEPAILKKIEAAKTTIEAQKQRKAQVLTVFADERSLQTLLIDLNREFNRRGRNVSLFNFNPSPSGPIDASLGPEVQGKLITQTIGINIDGSFAQTQALIRSLERLKPLILFTNFSTQRDSSQQKLVVRPSGATPTGEATLRSNITLQVVVTPVEAPASPAPAAPAAK